MFVNSWTELRRRNGGMRRLDMQGVVFVVYT